jgi:eukaryotic-like serine/threonine-protein kinase
MEPDRRHRSLSDVYHSALEKSPAERDAFLTEACAGDDALRQEVESLLAYESASSQFLGRPAAAVVAGGLARPDAVGRHLGPYTIVAPLGAGGMGEVYRARDSKLGRDVAVKILPLHFTADHERRARFAREARTLAILNHPHIGAIYGLEETDGVSALVLELVEGQTLADRLERGALRIPQALAIARQIAEALDTAHEKGIVHRDLKPANIVLQGSFDGLSADVRAKILDFGLAKTMTLDLASPPTQGPSRDGTADGRILGTPAYMSPEQARGLSVDKRTDIWAFGCVLFEMVTGLRAFDGATATDTLASVLEHEPDWTTLPPQTPPSIRALLDRCLRKDPRKRLHDIADALIEMDDAAKPDSAAGPATDEASRAARRNQPLTWMAAGILAGVVLTAGLFVVLSRRGNASPGLASELALTPPPGTRFEGGASLPFAIAPDGRHVAVIAVNGSAAPSLWIRALDASTDLRLLPGTEGVQYPFWSPDSKQVAFFATGKLKRVAIKGGAPVDVATAVGDVANGGGAWNQDGFILFKSSEGHLQKVKVAEAEGTPAPVTALQGGEDSHRWPWFLPDGQHFLFLAVGKPESQLRIGSLTSAETAPVGTIRTQALFAAGHLLFVDNTIMAQPFDLRSRRLTGEPISLGVRVMAGVSGRLNLSVSETNVLMYEAYRLQDTQLVLVDRTGNRVGTVGEASRYLNLSLSPDDRQVAVAFRAPDGNFDIGVMDLERGGTLRRVTDDDAAEFDPAWVRPDGTHLVFNSNRTVSYSLFRRPSDASGTDTLVVQGEIGEIGRARYMTPDSSPDGKFLIFVGGTDGTEELFVQALTGNAKPSPFFTSRFSELNPTFSPDGRFVAYTSNRTGRFEIYVRRFPQADGEQMISVDGASSPRWTSDTEIVFLSLDGDMMSARVAPAATSRSTPHSLFRTGLTLYRQQRPYDVTRDGRRFLLIVPNADTSYRPMIVLTNWTARLPR